MDDTRALIVVDVQRGFDDPRWGCRDSHGECAEIVTTADLLTR